MRKLIPLVCVALFMSVAAMTSPKPVTVEGMLIDTKCYGMNDVNINNTHKVPGENGQMMDMPNCATACAGMGIPAGIVEGGEAGGKVHIILAPAGALAEHMAKEARVTGEAAFDGGIIAMKVEVKTDGKWEEVHLPGMM